MKRYCFFAKLDCDKEPINKSFFVSRIAAARYFAAQKKLSLKAFLKIYSVSR